MTAGGESYSFGLNSYGQLGTGSVKKLKGAEDMALTPQLVRGPGCRWGGGPRRAVCCCRCRCCRPLSVCDALGCRTNASLGACSAWVRRAPSCS